MLKQFKGSIGYIELIYALQNNIPFGSVKNSSGQFVKASLESTTAAAQGVKMPADYRVSITNPPGKTAYPIASFTWLLIPQPYKDAAKGKIITEFLNWELDNGQPMANSLSYAPLPKEVSDKIRQTVKGMK